MADRYARATGNWNSTSTWSATSGGAAGASVPVAGDNVYIDTNYTVTLTANAECLSVFHTNGTLSLGSYTLTVGNGFGGSGFNSTGTTSRTLNLGSGTLDLIVGSSMGDRIELSGSNLNLVAGSSLVKVTLLQYSRTFATADKVFNDVMISLGSSTNSTTLNLTGTPTFRLLDVRSTNTAAQTLNFDGTANSIAVSKLVAIGSSTSNRLTLGVSGSSYSSIKFADGATSYGQFINIPENSGAAVINEDSGGSTGWQYSYIGSNSVDSSTTWVTQDPPKASTLVDPLTEVFSSSSNWQDASYSGVVSPTNVTTGYQGGGLRFVSNAGMVTSGSFDFVDNDLIIELPPPTGTSGKLVIAIGWLTGERLVFGMGVTGLYDGIAFAQNRDSSVYEFSSPFSGASNASIPATTQYIKIRYNSVANTYQYQYSSNGTSWSALTTTSNTNRPNTAVNLKSSKIQMNVSTSGTPDFTLGSVGILPPPTNTGAFFQMF